MAESDSSDSSLGKLDSFSGYSSSDLESPKEKIAHCKQQNSTTKAINDIMKHKIKFNVSLTSAQDVAKILNENSTEIHIPTNKTALKRHTEMRFKREYFIFCNSCSELCKDGLLCEECHVTTKREKFNFIINIPLEQQIKSTLDDNLDDIVECNNRQRCDFISDHDDGTMFKKISAEHPDHLILSFTLNTDGAQMSNSSKNSLWPVQMYQMYLPPNIRYKSENVLLSALYFGKKIPDMMKILQLLAQEIEWLQRNPIKLWRNEQVFKFIPVVLYCSVDLSAKAMLCGLKSYAGRTACTTCLHPGKQVVDHLKRKYTRYVKMEADSALRTHIATVSVVNSLNKKSSAKDSYGLVGIPTMILFPKFDLACGFVTDYLHNILLGVMKLLLDLWMGTHRLCKNSRHFQPITPQNRNTLDKRLLAIKPCEHITRKPRSVQDRAFFKGIEYRNLLLFYLKFALRGLIDNRYIKHFELLSAATYVLLKPALSEREIEHAGNMMNTFSNQFEDLYGEEAVTMNIHLLRHYAINVRQSGPMWAHSMFGFEKNIGVLSKGVANSTDIVETISFNYCVAREKKTIVWPEPGATKTRQEEISEYEQEILREKGVLPIKNKFVVSDSIKIKNQTFKSDKSKATNSIDRYMEMRDGLIGCATKYVKFKNDFYILFEEFDVTEEFYHLKRVKSTGKIKVYSCSDINAKLLYMKFGSFEIVTRSQIFTK